MTDNVVSITKNKPPTLYSINIEHHYSGELKFNVSGIGDNPSIEDKKSVLFTLKHITAIIETQIFMEENL